MKENGEGTEGDEESYPPAVLLTPVKKTAEEGPRLQCHSNEVSSSSLNQSHSSKDYSSDTDWEQPVGSMASTQGDGFWAQQSRPLAVRCYLYVT